MSVKFSVTLVGQQETNCKEGKKVTFPPFLPHIVSELNHNWQEYISNHRDFWRGCDPFPPDDPIIQELPEDNRLKFVLQMIKKRLMDRYP